MRLEKAVLAALIVIAASVACSKKAREEHGAGHDSPGPAQQATGPAAMTKGEAMVDPRRQQLIGVTYGRVERHDSDQLIRTVGTVASDESRLTDVSLKFEGWIEELLVDRTGALVERGQRLFTLYSPALVATQQDYLVAYEHYNRLRGSGAPKAVAGAKALLKASRQRLSYWDIEPKHIAELEQSRVILRTLPIHAPARGYVIEKNVVAGAHVMPGAQLYRLADLDRVWVLADVYEYELPFVQVGQEAQVTLAYLPGESFAGRIGYIYPYLSAKERTVKVRIELANTRNLLKTDMYVDVVLRARKRAVLTVPQSAVIDSGKRKVVFLALDEGRFEPREVELGSAFGDGYEVLRGLEEGQKVVTSGNFLLDSESQLAAGMRQMKH